ncbi:hypothetical protein XarjCFBP7653_05975 [Xanthomonas arboricola]|nr:hypothetical protein XarjCFBP7653_05975 [Xanthomonas arboricola]
MGVVVMLTGSSLPISATAAAPVLLEQVPSDAVVDIASLQWVAPRFSADGPSVRDGIRCSRGREVRQARRRQNVCEKRLRTVAWMRRHCPADAMATIDARW